jgi:hypothetical protein
MGMAHPRWKQQKHDDIRIEVNMTLHEYQAGREIVLVAQRWPYYALIQAAMRLGDIHNQTKLRLVFPEVWAELQARYNASDGHLPGDELTGEADLQPALVGELRAVLNKFCAENVSGTPDFIIAEYMLDIVEAYNLAVCKRAAWRGETAAFTPTHTDGVENHDETERQ